MSDREREENMRWRDCTCIQDVIRRVMSQVYDPRLNAYKAISVREFEEHLIPQIVVGIQYVMKHRPGIWHSETRPSAKLMYEIVEGLAGKDQITMIRREVKR